jgi:hypothetical protein
VAAQIVASYTHPRGFRRQGFLVLLDQEVVTASPEGGAVSMAVAAGEHEIDVVVLPRREIRRYQKKGKLSASLRAGLKLRQRRNLAETFVIGEGETKYVSAKQSWFSQKHHVLDEDPADESATSIKMAVPPVEEAATVPVVGEPRLPSSAYAEIELIGEPRVVVRSTEFVTVHPGATYRTERSDEVEETILIDPSATDVDAGISVGVIEIALRHSLRQRPGRQYRTFRQQLAEIKLDGRAASEWEIRFEDEWQRARYVRDGQSPSVEFQYLKRTNAFAMPINAR